MLPEPIEVPALPTRRRSQARRAATVVASSAIDEAFAVFTRIDAAESAAESIPSWRNTKQELVANIATQLEALDRQRDQLARLLEEVDANNLG